MVAGRFWDETDTVRRKEVLSRLERLADHVSASVAQLSSLRGGLHTGVDVEVINLLVRAVNLNPAGPHPNPREPLGIMLRVLEGLERYCTQALLLVADAPAKKGQRGLRWYDEYVTLMKKVADLLNVKVSTAGDRAEAPHATPFTVLLFNAERVLPEEAQSNTLVACAKRIERSLKRLRAVPPDRIEARAGAFRRVTTPEAAGTSTAMARHRLQPGGHMRTHDDHLFTPNEAAAYMKVSGSYLAKARMRGTGPAFIQLGRAVRYSRAALEAYKSAHTRLSTSDRLVAGPKPIGRRYNQ